VVTTGGVDKASKKSNYSSVVEMTDASWYSSFPVFMTMNRRVIITYKKAATTFPMKNSAGSELNKMNAPANTKTVP